MNAMLRRLLFVAIPAALLGAGCHIHDLTSDCWDHGCGPAVSRSYDFSGFDSIRVEDAFRVTVRQSADFRVEARVPEDAEDDLEIRQDGNWLHIGGAAGCGGNERQVTVELPLLRRLEAEEASRITLDGLSSSGRLELSLAEASHVGGDLVADTTALRLSLASSADLSGTTDRLELNATEASQGSLRDLSARRADVDLSAASNATIAVSDWLDVTASGASVLRYIGDPQLGRVELTGGSRLERER